VTPAPRDELAPPLLEQLEPREALAPDVRGPAEPTIHDDEHDVAGIAVEPELRVAR